MIAYRPEIDGLRAIAIASAVLYHALSPVFPGGFVGVDIFFVISGYLITSIILKEMNEGGFSYLNFYARRARRILPALFALLVAVTIAVTIVFLPTDFIKYSELLISAILFAANFSLAHSPGYFDATMQENPLLHIWSLSVEEQFYFLWPTLLIVMLRVFSRRGLIAAVLTLATISLVAAEITVHIWPRSAFFHLPARGWELLTGAAIAMNLFPPLKSRLLSETLSAIGVALMAAPVFLYTKETVFPGISALPPVAGCALVIYANGNCQATGFSRTGIASILSSRPMVFLGLISYSLYLWHWPVLALPSYILMRPLEPTEALVCVVASLVLAAISWRYIERPFRKRLATPLGSLVNFKWISIPALTASGYAAVGLTVFLISAGGYIQNTRGAAWRFNNDVRALTERFAPKKKNELCIGQKPESEGVTECQFGDLSTDLILWGDSHAKHYLPMIAKAYGRGRAYIGCTPLAGARRVTLSGRELTPGCEQAKSRVIAEILKLKPRVLVLAGRWSVIEELPYGRELRENSYLVDASMRLTREGSRETFARSIGDTARIFADAGIKVVLMGQVPEMKISTNHCRALSIAFGFTNSNCGLVSREEAERRQFYVNRALDAVAQSNPNVFVFHPFPYFCSEVRCDAVKNGKVLYSDNDHLNETGALELLEPFRHDLPEGFRLPSSRTAGADETVSR